MPRALHTFISRLYILVQVQLLLLAVLLLLLLLELCHLFLSGALLEIDHRDAHGAARADNAAGVCTVIK